MNWRNKNVLVAGGAGMIGSHMARRLVKEGANVTVVDDLSSGSPQNIKDIRKDIKFYVYDLRDASVCKTVCDNKFAVFVFAANMGGIGWLENHHYDIGRDNILINANLLDACRINSVDHVYESSSACCYNISLQDTDKEIRLSEGMAWPALPNEIYGLEKLYMEELALSYIKDCGMNIKIGRHHNVYDGCFTSFCRDKSKAPCGLILKAIEHPETPFTIWGDGSQIRSFLYVDDCIEMVLRLMDTNYNKPINIGTEQGVRISYLAELAIKASGKNIEPKYDLSKPQGVKSRNSDNTLFREIVGYEPKVTLEEGIPMVYSWAIENYKLLEGI
jgi:nucleoside-diphosphate-sugar epimerase